jgi:hypothetical protein
VIELLSRLPLAGVRMTGLLLLLPFADAPNPAFCPHHRCQSSPAGTVGVVLIVVVLVVVVAVASLLIWRLTRRRRRRARQP